MSLPDSQIDQRNDAAQAVIDIKNLKSHCRISLTLSLITFVVCQGFWINATPIKTQVVTDAFPGQSSTNLVAGTGPDELPHYIYILSLYETGHLPAPQPELRSDPNQFVSHEAQHPPIYYVLADGLLKVFHKLGDHNVWLMLRSTNTIFGMIAIWLISASALAVFKSRPLVVLGVPPFLATLPIFGYVCATVSNIALEMVFTSWALLIACRIVTGERKIDISAMAQLGFAAGLAGATRLTGLIWLPGFAVLIMYTFAKLDRQDRARAMVSMAVGALVCAACILPWLIHCKDAFGAAFYRSDYRPMLAHISLIQYLADPHQPISTFNTTTQIAIPPKTILLWYASSAWAPFWLIQYALPGFPDSVGAFQAIFVLVDIALIYLLARNAVSSRGKESADPAYIKPVLWAFGVVTALSVVMMLQQQFYVDEIILTYAGRYIISAVAGSAMLALFAISTVVPKTIKAGMIGAIVIGAVGIGFNIWCIHLLYQFYASAG